jgi:hypothetical protein
MCGCVRCTSSRVTAQSCTMPWPLLNSVPSWRKLFFAAYAAGFQVEPFPGESGQLLPKGTVLKFQLHYTAVGYATTDRPRLAIYLHKRPPPRELVVNSAWTRTFRILRMLRIIPLKPSLCLTKTRCCIR